MKKIASFVLTTALVLGMGASAFAAATPSKVVLDEVKADASVTVSGLSSLIGAKVEIKKAEEAAKTAEEVKRVEEQTKSVLTDVAANVDLKAAVSEVLPQEVAAGTGEHGKKEDVKVEVTAVQTFSVETERLADSAKVEVALESKMIDTAYAENEELVVLVAVPKVDAATGKVTYTYTKVKAVYKDGKINMKLTGKQLKTFGSNFTVMALKQVKQKAV